MLKFITQFLSIARTFTPVDNNILQHLQKFTHIYTSLPQFRLKQKRAPEKGSAVAAAAAEEQMEPEEVGAAPEEGRTGKVKEREIKKAADRGKVKGKDRGDRQQQIEEKAAQ